MNKEKYLEPFTDFGFKKLFGTEANKDLLIDFLNSLLKGRKQIRNIAYTNNEQLGKTPASRRAVFDLTCESDNGEKFIVELQKVKQQFFKDRNLYYSTFPIQEQGVAGDSWNYYLPEIITIGIMDFTFSDAPPEHYQHEVKLVELTTRKVFYEKLTFIFLEMPKFVKKEEELETHFDRWVYLLRNLSELKEVPAIFQEPILRKVFTIAALSNLNKEDMTAYEASLKEKRDWNSAMDTAIREAMEKGIEEGVLLMARQMKKEGVSIDLIVKVTGLSKDKIEKL
jgi:predicted transposase/invertase (TIGR01784 family)